jgi:acetyl esterase/lipase
LPVEARLLSLSADPETAGTFGREGLRVVAMFEFTSADAESYGRRVAGASGWGELPIPAVVRRLREPPSELPSARRGLVYCRIGVWREGTEFNEYACGSVARPDHYRTAVLDLEHGKLTAVFKNYY